MLRFSSGRGWQGPMAPPAGATDDVVPCDPAPSATVHPVKCDNCRTDVDGVLFFCCDCGVAICSAHHDEHHGPHLTVKFPLPRETYDWPCAADRVSKEEWKDILREECELRVAPESIETYRRLGQDNTDAIDSFTESLQEQVVRRHKIADVERGVLLLRSCLTRYPDDPEFQSIPFYVKYNKCFEGELVAGVPAPDLPLLRLDCAARTTKPAMLHSAMQPHRPLVVAAGSGT
eukprot:comp22187_c0_seq1/m.52255 comp22187_c0_seq1/g.52255  ORF comp22187_c0_seq1/g.52255 comp22187_c0_seq1/m.52255 type:complete len:232 (-) comp22187_c0_seq1:665-1360(-)